MADQVVGIGHLRHPPGVHERSELNAVHTGIHQQRDQAALLRQRKKPGFTLESVTQGLIFETDVGIHASPSRRGWIFLSGAYLSAIACVTRIMGRARSSTNRVGLGVVRDYVLKNHLQSCYGRQSQTNAGLPLPRSRARGRFTGR